jgi:hypothetical protein
MNTQVLCIAKIYYQERRSMEMNIKIEEAARKYILDKGVNSITIHIKPRVTSS